VTKAAPHRAATARSDQTSNGSARVSSHIGGDARCSSIPLLAPCAAHIASGRRERRGLAAVTVTLDSPGGAHFEGLRLGLLLQRKGIGTRIMPRATCFSACASIFFGGFNRKTGKPNRVAHEGSRLGVHRMTHVSGIWSAEIERRVGAAAQVYFADMRLSEKVRRMFTETPPHDIYILTLSDMAESDITFVPSSGADSRPRKQPTAAPRVSTIASAS
jgi:hypothetical protein